MATRKRRRTSAGGALAKLHRQAHQAELKAVDAKHKVAVATLRVNLASARKDLARRMQQEVNEIARAAKSPARLKALTATTKRATKKAAKKAVRSAKKTETDVKALLKAAKRK